MVKYGEPCVICGDEGHHVDHIQPVVFDPLLTQAEADAYWKALNDEEEGADAGMVDEAARRAWVRSQLTPAERRMVRMLDAFDRVRVWIVQRFGVSR